MTRTTQHSPHKLTKVEKKQRAQAASKGRKALSKTTLRRDGEHVPDRVGGKTPPIAAGKRRAFGLRGLEY